MAQVETLVVAVAAVGEVQDQRPAVALSLFIDLIQMQSDAQLQQMAHLEDEVSQVLLILLDKLLESLNVLDTDKHGRQSFLVVLVQEADAERVELLRKVIILDVTNAGRVSPLQRLVQLVNRVIFNLIKMLS